MQENTTLLSIVTTLYYSSPYIREFYRRITDSARKVTENYEIIMVNDGSPDDSLETAIAIAKNDRRITVVDLSRNFGHHKAAMTGLSYARGERVFITNCDLEEGPENLVAFYEKALANGDCDVVYGVHSARQGNFARRMFGNIFYRLLNGISKIRFENGMLFSRLMTRRYVASLLQFRESELFMAGLWQLAGYRQIPLTIETYYKGCTTYTFQKKVELAVNAITSFSNMPLVFISYLGILISALSGSFILYLLVRKIFFSASLLGWTSLIVSIWFVGGLLLLCMGVIGIYLAKIFIETKKRPYTIVKSVYHAETEISGNDFQPVEYHP